MMHTTVALKTPRLARVIICFQVLIMTILIRFLKCYAREINEDRAAWKGFGTHQ
jgi:hypothetical protein